MAANKLLLNYHDACLYSSDLEILMTPQSWLNDSCINFRLTQLQQYIKTQQNSSEVCFFMDPSVLSYIMHQCDDDDLKDLYHSLSLHEKQYLFIPMNDGMDVSTDMWKRPGGGSHYSLLFVVTQCDTSDDSKKPSFFHFDSSQHRNAHVARMVSQRIWELLNIKRPEQTTFRSPSLDITKVIHECQTPQQRNGYDCGLYALKTIEALLMSPDITPNTLISTAGKTKILSMSEFQKQCEDVVRISMTTTQNFANELKTQMVQDIRKLSQDYLSKN